MKRILAIAVSAILLMSCGSAICQVTEITEPKDAHVVVVLKNGHPIEGYLKEWAGEEQIKLRLQGVSDLLSIEQSEIRGIYPKASFDSEEYANELYSAIEPKAPYNYKHTGLYKSARAQVIVPNDGNRANGVSGFGLSISAGHKFNRLLAVGLGVGYDQYIWNSGEEMIPIFAEISGNLSPKNTSLFYNLQTGYSIALSDDQYGISEASGGLMIYPALGIRFGKESHKFGFDLGYKFQKANYVYVDRWTRTTFHDQRIHYKRMSLRFSIIL